MTEWTLQYFSYEHLHPPEAKKVSKLFHDLAHHLAQRLHGSPEKSVALRKLLEAKDAAVRASLERKDSLRD